MYAVENPNSLCAVVVPTFGDIRRVAFGGPSGLMSVIPRECLLSGSGQGYNVSSAEIKLWNGSKILGFSAEEPDRLRGPQFHRAWCDELAAWKNPETFDQLMFGLRLGESPRCIITTTPKPTKIIRNLMSRPDVHIHRGSTFDNAANLAPQALEALKERYAGTNLGRQELYAEILDDTEGALWTYDNLEQTRRTVEQVPDLLRVVVAIDPAVTNNEGSDETGIVVAGVGVDGRYYVLDDNSGRMSADVWARTSVQAYYKYDADRIVAEVNNGGDLVERLLRTIDTAVPYTPVTASRGKLVRAEPIAAMYEQGKVSHVGTFPQLEEQLCTFTLGSRTSPDRLDALVWALTELSLSSGKAVWRIS
jgi:predicted phage terminase large subunit-like protein